MAELKVIKESGDIEDFDREKVRRSLLSCGARPEEADSIIHEVKLTLAPPLTTRKIFREVKKRMRRCGPAPTMRYSLKQAIYALGPTGYPFERYVGRILEARGYQVEVGVIVPGYCVAHEVDVVARKGRSRYMVECKFHRNGKTRSNVQTALYVHARFLDISRARKRDPAGQGISRGMILTNTRFSSEAVKFARCSGIEAVGWKHPDHTSLERMIDEARTYPVTVLPAARRPVAEALLRRDIILARDVAAREHKELVGLTGLDPRTVGLLKKQAAEIAPQ